MRKPLAKTLPIESQRAYQVPRRLATCGTAASKDLLRGIGSRIDFFTFEKLYWQERNLLKGMCCLRSFAEIVTKLLIYNIVLVLKSKHF